MAILQTSTSTLDTLTPRTADEDSDSNSDSNSDSSSFLAIQDREKSSSSTTVTVDGSPSPSYCASQPPEAVVSHLNNEDGTNSVVKTSAVPNAGDPSLDVVQLEHAGNTDCNKDDAERDLSSGETKQSTPPTSPKSTHSSTTSKDISEEQPKLSNFKGSNNQCLMGDVVKKTVRFYPMTDIRRVCKLDDFAPANDIWYTQVELLKLRPDMKEIKRLYKNCESECVRGLEYRTKQGNRKRSSNYIDAELAVMDEQMFQDESGLNDPAKIAKVYAHAAQIGRNEAHIKGLLDEAFCQEFVYCLPVSTKAKEAQENKDWDSLKGCTCHAKVWQQEHPIQPQPPQKRKPLRGFVRRVIESMGKNR
jgi:hypothetical protein